MYATSPYTREELEESSELSEDMAYYSYGSELYDVRAEQPEELWLGVISEALFTFSLKQYVEMYKVIILLTLPFIV